MDGLVVPGVGTFDTEDEADCLHGLEKVRNAMYLLHQSEQELKRALRRLSDRTAVTLRDDLLAAGMTEEEADKVVVETRYFKVDTTAAARAAAANPVYAQVIEGHTRVEERPHSVSVSRTAK